MRKTMTYGVMPSEKEFSEAFSLKVGGPTFAFGNDERVGTDALSEGELWRELERARAEFEAGDEKAGDWASSVLSCLGFTWV